MKLTTRELRRTWANEFVNPEEGRKQFDEWMQDQLAKAWERGHGADEDSPNPYINT
jgi:hypothetical protein